MHTEDGYGIWIWGAQGWVPGWTKGFMRLGGKRRRRGYRGGCCSLLNPRLNTNVGYGQAVVRKQWCMVGIITNKNINKEFTNSQTHTKGLWMLGESFPGA